MHDLIEYYLFSRSWLTSLKEFLIKKGINSEQIDTAENFYSYQLHLK